MSNRVQRYTTASRKPIGPSQSITVSWGAATGDSKSLLAHEVRSCQNLGEKSNTWASLKS